MGRKVILIVLMFFTSGLAFAEELSISECLEIGLANNLDIKIAKIEPLIEEENVRAARSIFDTILQGEISYEDDQFAQSSTIFGTKNLETNYEIGVDTKLRSGTELEIDYSSTRNWSDSAFSVNNPLHTAELSFTATQPILKNSFGYVDRRSVKLSQIEAKQAGMEALGRIEDTVADIEKAYWQLVYAEYEAGLRKELLVQAERLFEIFEKHLKTGLAESTESYEIEANMKIRQTELEIAENNLKTASNNLALLLNVDIEKMGTVPIRGQSPFSLAGAEFCDRGEALKEALFSSRDYKAAKKGLEGKKVKVKMKENSLWPEVDLVGTLAVNGVDRKYEKANRRLSTNKFSRYYGGIEASFPLENREAISDYNKAKLEKEKAILELVKVEKELITKVDQAVRGVNLSLENARRWANIRGLQKQKFKDEEKKLKYGRSNSKTIIDYQDDLTRASLSEYRAILEYYTAMVDLEDAKDTLLRGVGVTK